MSGITLGPIGDLALLGGGTAFPRRELTNLDLVARGRRARGEEHQRFVADGLRERLGVERRRWAHLPGEPFAPDEETTLDLATAAARVALAEAGVSAELLLAFTSTPHRFTSTLAAPLGAALGLAAACLDARAGCASGIWALAAAALHLQAGIERALLVGAETFSKIIPPASELAAATLADGAGALVLGHGGGSLLAACFETDGTRGQLVRTDGPLPPTAEAIAAGGYLLAGEPDGLLAEIPRRYEQALGQALDRAGLRGSDIDLYVPHQTGRAVIEWVAARFGFRDTFVNLHEHGNLGAAGWIAALVEARAAGRVGPGARVALAAVGGGLSFGAAVLEC